MKKLADMTEEERAINDARNKARREARKAARLAGSLNSTASSGGDPVPSVLSFAGAGTTSIPVDVQTQAPEVDFVLPEEDTPPLTLKERLFGPSAGKAGDTAAGKRSRKKRGDSNLFTQVLPTVLASFIATYSRYLIREPYKICAPSVEECNLILSPLLAIIGRHIEISGKASQDVIDFTNALICGLAYGTRAFITYLNIREYEGRVSANANGTQSDDRAFGFSPVSNDGNVEQRPERAGRGVPDNSYGADSDARDEAAIVAALFARDKRGRLEMGLV